jgi:2-polyprenyl-3-methyl-5-hydroxy-6-metoxy-1,4-benzoquinol methylase
MGHMARVCPLCNEIDFATWRFGLLRCEKCELVVDEAVWRPESNKQMEEAFFGERYQPVRSFWVQLFEALNNRRTMRRLRSQAGLAGSLLEIGVGSGSFLAYAKARGFVSLGCDLSAAICSRVERNTAIEMHCGPLESLPDQRQFDVIVMNHVLEHVSDPLALLRVALARLKPGGVLHLAVPNVAAWEARLQGWNSYEPYHLLYFTPRTLRATAEEAGFQILEVVTHESFSGWFLAILRTLVRENRTAQIQQRANTSAKPSTSILEHGYRLTMVVWGLLTLPLRRLQELLGKGDEVILLARNATDDR